MAISKIVPQSTGFGDANVGLQIPNISFENRAASAANGSIIFNTSNNEIQVFANGSWSSVGAGGGPAITSITGSIDSGNTGSTISIIGVAFDVSNSLLPGTLRFVYNGTTTDVTVTPNTSLAINSVTIPEAVLAEAPETDGTIQFIRADGKISNAFSKPLSSTAYLQLNYLVIGGGGGGGVGHGGGGGAGGYRTNWTSAPGVPSPKLSGGNSAIEAEIKVINNGTNYPVTVGAGGSGGNYPGTNNANGSPSIFNTITSTGGGAGGNQDGSPGGGGQKDGKPGGSGGGGGNTTSGSGTGGSGTPGQGTNGGTTTFNGSPWMASGGGGASAVGVANTPSDGGPGGAGLFSDISGSSVRRGGGGGGGGPPSGSGGAGGGGAGSNLGAGPGTPGTINTGGGGGGGRDDDGGSGGSGVVILRYPSLGTLSNPGGGLTFSSTPSGSNTITTITAGTGNISWS